MANFSTASKVLQVIRSTDDAERMRSANRTKILDAANCVPYWSDKDADDMGLKVNVNFGELMELLAEARRQFMSAFWGQQYQFKVTLPKAPADTQSEWGAAITEFINKPLRESLEYFELHRSKWASVVCHGLGPQVWWNPDRWLPSYVALSDIRIPTDTTTDFHNLDWWAVRRVFTPYEFLSEAFSKRARNYWEKEACAAIIKRYKEENIGYAPNHYEWDTNYEKLAELLKQDGGYYASSAIPGIPLWYFYFKDDTDRNNSGVFLRIVPETGTTKSNSEQKFLWTSNEPIAKYRKNLLHMQVGDLANDSPPKVHSVRSMGYALMEPTFYNNFTICRTVQHLGDALNVWLQVTDPVDKARPTIQEFANFGVLKSGVNVVPNTQRHQVNPALIQMVLAQMKQLQQEKSASYTQATDTGTQKEQTAFETRVKVERVNAMTAGILLPAFIYETHSDIEICRRFCLKHTPERPVTDEDILEFQANCREAGIPDAWVDSRKWHIERVTPLGMGNPTIAQAAAQQLMQQRGAYGPEAQQEILHESTLVITQDPRKARRWAPIGKKPTTTTGGNWAASIFGTLMQGVPVPPPQDVSPAEQLDVLLPMLAGVINKIAKRDSMATPDETAGLTTVAQYIGMLLQRLGTDPIQKQRVKQYSDVLGRLMNEVKALAQRGVEARQKAQQSQGTNGELQSKIAERMLMAKTNARIREAQAAQDMQIKNREHLAESRRKDHETAHGMLLDNLQRSHEQLTSMSE